MPRLSSRDRGIVGAAVGATASATAADACGPDTGLAGAGGCADAVLPVAGAQLILQRRRGALLWSRRRGDLGAGLGSRLPARPGACLAPRRLPGTDPLRDLPVALAVGPGAGQRHHLPPGRAALALLGTILTAALSYRLMEKPILAGRVPGWRRDGRTLLTALACMALILLAAAPLGGSFLSPAATAALPPKARDPKTVMVVGDSVPYHLMPELDRAGRAKGLTIVDATMRGCSPLGVVIKSAPNDVLGPRTLG